MTEALDEELQSALAVDDPTVSVDRVKQIVERTLRATDNTATVVRTSYFNHTYVPDFVLEWNGRGSDSSRQVFLRPTQDPREIERDIRDHADLNAMYVHLSDLIADPPKSPDDSNEMAAMTEVALSRSALVTEVSAVREFAPDASSSTSRLLSSSILRGGRGLIDQDDASRTVETVSLGFEAAMIAERDLTAEAVEAIGNLLRPSVATELTMYLEDTWLGSGGLATEFPGLVHELGSKLSPSRLRVLLEIIASDNEDFWLRVGQSVDLDSFLGLHLVGEQPALQAIVSASLPKLSSRICRLLVTERADQESDPFLWQVDNGLLSLRGSGKQAWIGSRKSDLSSAPEVSGEDTPSVSSVSARAVGADISITSLEITGGSRSLTYGSDSGKDGVANDELVETLTDALGEGTGVARATALVDSSSFTVDYRTRTGALNSTRAHVPVAKLINTTWMLMSSVSEDERAALRGVLGDSEYNLVDLQTPEGARTQPELGSSDVDEE